MIKIRTRSLIALVTVSLMGGTQSHATIIQQVYYPLGEPGTVGAVQPYTSLTDIIGVNTIPNWNGDTTRTGLLTSGLAAPGSTAGLQVLNNAGGGGTWFGGTVNSGTGYSDNYAFDIWVRPDATGGTFLGATDGDGGAQVGLRLWAANTTANGTTLGGNTVTAGTPKLLLSNGSGFLGSDATTYTAGNWYRVTIIRHTGTVHYYLDEVLQDSATTSGLVNDIRLGAGYWAQAGTNAGYDELKIYTFDSGDSLASVEQAVFTVIPEPASAGLLLLGAGTLAWFRRR